MNKREKNTIESTLDSARRHHSLAAYAIASFADASAEAGMHFFRAWRLLAETRASFADPSQTAADNFLDNLPYGTVLPESIDASAWRGDILAWSNEEARAPALPLHLHLWALERGIASIRREARAKGAARLSSPTTRRALVFGALSSALAAACLYVAMNYEFGPLPWRATYYQGTKLEGAPLLERSEKRLAHNWQTGSPSPRVPADDFSARWAVCLPLDAGSDVYFTIDSYGGARFSVDDELIVDSQEEPAVSYVTPPMRLEPGLHLLQVEYFEFGGYASISLEAYVAGYSRPLLEPKRLKPPVRRADGSWYCP